MGKTIAIANKCIAVTLLGTLVFFACRRTSDFYASSADGPLNVSSAKKYYKEFIKTAGRIVPVKFSENGSGTTFDQRGAAGTASAVPNNKYIMWKKAYTSETDKFSFVEAPLYYNQKISALITKQEEVVDDKVLGKIFAASLNRLIVYKDKQSGAIGQYIVNYIPDITYLQKYKYDISRNQINKLDKDFTGYVKYITWDGEPMAIFKMKNGKTISKGKYKREIINGRTLRTFPGNTSAREVCNYYTEQIWVSDCWVMDPETGNVACDGHYITVSYEECYDDGNDDDNGGGGYSDPCMDPANFYLPECYGNPDPGDGSSDCDGCPQEQPENLEGTEDICSNSFKFSKVINVDQDGGGWQLAAVGNIHMTIVDFRTGETIRINPGSVLYFGLPISTQSNGYYSASTAATIAAGAVEKAEKDVMSRYHTYDNMPNFYLEDILNMNGYFRERINYYMSLNGGSATRTPGYNISSTPIQAKYSGIAGLGCL